MQAAFDTIAAIATARGRGAIGVLRISGPMTESVVDRLFSAKAGLKAEDFGDLKLRFGSFRDSDGEVLDNGLVFFSKAPKSYTGEDYAELQCHGNPYIMEKLLASAVSSGAVPAPPGEFTRRAFLNGKMDLTECEGVDELIRASSKKYASAAFRLQNGELRKKLEPISEALSRVYAHIQGAIEFSDDVNEDRSMWSAPLDAAVSSLREILSSAEVSRKVRDGLLVAIAGKPNAGKSSLFNALLEEDRALVTSVAGTTRDTLSEEIEIAGLNVILMDTAGLRKAKGEVEALGVERSLKNIDIADAVIWLSDGAKKMSAEEKDLVKEWSARKPLLLLSSKSDLAGSKIEGAQAVSCVTKEGLKEVRDFLYKTAQEMLEGHEDLILLRSRHQELLESALESVEKAFSGLQKGEYLELIAEELGSALERIWEVTGKKTPNEILDIIFREFCVGK
ncbi:tRNA uridine-5-carboxymethylaminomethyl(34) synthesis GTPase MnmE [bacterium]|nr:tRNA uridine-5-carboxymethylaminomethyl(34) synthesis GTPase MnmE [bacterium]